jgi:PAS domain S-box-containing protein
MPTHSSSIVVDPTHVDSGEPPRTGTDAPAPQSEELYRQLFEHNPQPMWVYDLETLRFLTVNRAAVDTYGYAFADFLRMTIKDIRPAEDVPRLLDDVAAKDRADFARAGLWRHRRRDGSLLWVEIFSHYLTYGGRPARLVLAHDVTERKAIEEALRESEQRYRALFNQSPLGVLHFDRDLRVLAANSPLARAVGFTSADALTGFELTGLRDQRILPTLRQALAGERSLYEGPYRATHRDVHVWIAVHVSPITDTQGQVQGGIAVIEEITERKRAEARLAQQARALEQVNATLRQRTQQLEAALGARSRLYAAMNHELRTPISTIMLYNDLLISGAAGPLSPSQQESVEHAQRAAQHLLELVQDVLDLARIEAGRMDIIAEPVSMHELVQDLLDTFQPLVEQLDSSVRMTMPEPDCQVATDAKRVRQIVLNLLANALKFGEGKPISLGCARTPDGGVEIAVTDRGVGIAPEDMERIFDDFVQVGPHAQSGSGLGLSISRRLAELLGGSLSVRSERGQGSTFSLRLPPSPPAGADTRMNSMTMPGSA